MGMTALVLTGLLLTGASEALAHAGRRVAPNAFAAVAIYVALLAAVQEATGFPLVLYRTYFLERHYGLSTEPFRVWLKDQLKASALGLLLGVAGAEAVYWLLRHSPDWWWVLSAALFVILMGLLAKAAPILLLPIFYKFKPLER